MVASKKYHTIVLPTSGSFSSVLWATMNQLESHFRRQNELVVIIIDLSRSDNRLSANQEREFWSMAETLNEGICSVSFQGRYKQMLFDNELIKILILTNLSRQEILAGGNLSSDRYIVIGKNKNGTTY